MLARKVHHLSHFRFGDFDRVHPADADAIVMDVQHDAGGLLTRLVEEVLQDEDHELHRGIVIVKQQDPVQGRLLRLGLGPRGDTELLGRSGGVLLVGHACLSGVRAGIRAGPAVSPH